MTLAQLLIVLIPIGYLLGSIPFGLIVGLAKGVDPRAAGSGNIGATNVGRLLGGRYFALVFMLDLLKGMLPMAAASAIVWRLQAQGQTAASTTYLLWLLVGFAAILGHMFSLFLRFHGGKGVATSAGVALGLFPYYSLPGLAAMAVWALIFFRSRYVSLASIIAAAVFPLAYIGIGLAAHWPVFGQQLPLLAFAVFVGAMVIVKHRANIARLRAGTESRFAPKAG